MREKKLLPSLIITLPLASLWLGAGLLRAQGATVQQTQLLDASAQEHIRELIASLPSGSQVREALERGARGDGVHYPWMDKMRQLSVKRALLSAHFEWHGRPTRVRVTEVLYFSKYDNDCAQITDAERLEEIRASGLKQELEEAAIERTEKAHWYFTIDRPYRHTKQGTCTVQLVDDESLPVPPPMLAPLSKSKDPLVGFVARGDEAGARQQIERGVSPKELAAALWQTITFGHNSCMTKLLLKSGASVNIQDEAGYTPLINAVRARNSADVKLLLEAGANPNAQDRWGETPLRIAIRDGSSEIVELLQRAGARP